MFDYLEKVKLVPDLQGSVSGWIWIGLNFRNNLNQAAQKYQTVQIVPTGLTEPLFGFPVIKRSEKKGFTVLKGAKSPKMSASF